MFCLLLYMSVKSSIKSLCYMFVKTPTLNKTFILYLYPPFTQKITHARFYTFIETYENWSFPLVLILALCGLMGSIMERFLPVWST